MKYLGTHWTQYLYPAKEIAGGILRPKQWKYIPYSWIGTVNVKMSCLPKFTYRFNRIWIKIPAGFKNWNWKLKCTWKCKEYRISQQSWRRTKLKALKLLDLKTRCKALVNSTACCWHKKRRNRGTYAHMYVVIAFFSVEMLGTEARTSCTLSKHSATELVTCSLIFQLLQFKENGWFMQ